MNMAKTTPRIASRQPYRSSRKNSGRLAISEREMIGERNRGVYC
jgi:hypothetical protein